MSEATNNTEATTEENNVVATDTSAQQGDTKSDSVVEGADTKKEGLLNDTSTSSEKSEEAKPDSEKKSEASDGLLGKVEQQEGQEQAPEKYEPFTLADGKEMDASDVEALSAIAKEHNLSQESAQKAALVANDLLDNMVKEHEEHKAKLLQENADTWKKQDPNGERTLLARKAVEKLGEDMHNHLKENGYLDDARIMSLLSDYGQLISEGKSISGKPAQQQSLLYPNTPELYNSQ